LTITSTPIITNTAIPAPITTTSPTQSITTVTPINIEDQLRGD
jgi:hypothetical protein